MTLDLRILRQVMAISKVLQSPKVELILNLLSMLVKNSTLKRSLLRLEDTMMMLSVTQSVLVFMLEIEMENWSSVERWMMRRNT